MLKKDYQAIAGAIYRARMRSFNDQAQHNRSMAAVVNALVDVLQADNPRFDCARFIEACETYSSSRSLGARS
jgi:hypothetical protein